MSEAATEYYVVTNHEVNWTAVMSPAVTARRILAPVGVHGHGWRGRCWRNPRRVGRPLATRLAPAWPARRRMAARRALAVACDDAGVVDTRTPWGPVLGSRTVRLEPIEPDLARSMLAGVPGPALDWEQGFPMSPVLDFARTIAAAPQPLGPFGAFVIIRVRDGLAVGDAGFHGPPNADGEVEIGYAVVPVARGAGIGREAARLLVAWSLSQPAVRAVAARVEAGNTPSERLLASLGFTRDGTRDGMRRFVLRTP